MPEESFLEETYYHRIAPDARVRVPARLHRRPLARRDRHRPRRRHRARAPRLPHGLRPARLRPLLPQRHGRPDPRVGRRQRPRARMDAVAAVTLQLGCGRSGSQANRPSSAVRARCASGSTTCTAHRQRIIEAADAERRRIERDLHDGAQQRMVARRGHAGPGRVEARRATRERGAAGRRRRARRRSPRCKELRELARGIHPAVLSDRGLGAGARGAGVACARPGRGQRRARGAAAPAVEAAVYFVTAETLTNVAKYARRVHGVDRARRRRRPAVPGDQRRRRRRRRRALGQRAVRAVRPRRGAGRRADRRLAARRRHDRQG